MSEADVSAAVDAAEVALGLTAEEEFDLKCAKHLRNDVGNARRLIDRFGRDLMWVREVGWFAWVGTHWSREDGERQAHLFAHKTAQAMWQEVAAMIKAGRDEDESPESFNARVTSHRKWARGAGNSGRLKAMLGEAAPYLLRTIDELDVNPFLFNAANGTIELKRGGMEPLRPHAREDFITRVSPVAYEAGVSATVFRGFLQRIIPDDDARQFLQRYLGYCLTGSTAEQVLLLCHGEGANGKSTLCDLMGWVLGDYAMNIHFSSLLHDDRRRGGEATPDIARLPGARFVLAAEPEMGARFSESTVKQLTGGDSVTARHLNRDFFEFKPQFKLLLSANHKPTVRGQDDGIWRRVLLLPFDQKIPPEERDRDLGAKLRAEGSGVLNWLLDGAWWWMEGGMQVPEVIRAAVEEYRSESDPVGMFLEACTIRREGALEKAKDLFDAYVQWCKDNAQNYMSSTAFGKRLTDRGIKSLKKGVVFRTGVELVRDAALDAGGDVI